MLNIGGNQNIYQHKLFNPHQVINPHPNQNQEKLLDKKQLDLIVQANIDDEQTKKIREIVIQELKQLLSDWLIQQDEQQFEVHVFGSHRLGLNHKYADIDMIMVAQRIERETHFFAILPQWLEANPNITNLYIVQEAMVPVIRFKYQGIHIDLIFSQVISFSNPISSSSTVDDKSLRSINGLKVSDYFHQKATSVSNQIHQTTQNMGFQQRNLQWNYGIFGRNFITDISIENSSTVSQILCLLPTRQNMPIMIENSTEDVWKSFNETQQHKAVMTVYTPIYPQINSTHNVSAQTLLVIQDALIAGFNTIQKIKNKELTWQDLYKKFMFFEHYSYFFQIKALSRTQKDLVQWKGHIESRLRKLNKLFESQTAIQVHLYPRAFDTSFEDQEKEFYSKSFFYGIRLTQQGQNQEINLEQIAAQFCDCLEGSKPYVKVPEYLNIELKIVKKDFINKKIKIDF
ncbi:hypothetical protein pb186bvf_003052 [Paramecium bursaria]